MKLSIRIKNNIRFISAIVILGAAGGILYSWIRSEGNFFLDLASSGVIGGSIAVFCGFGEFWLFHHLRFLPFMLLLLSRVLYFTGVTLLVLVSTAAIGINPSGFPSTGHFITATFVTLAIAFVASLFQLMNRMLGRHVLLDFFTGRYHQPKEEERMFMFLDVVASTTLAERMGHLKFHRYLDDIFCSISDAILASKGEIYKYVGDEVIISWNISKNRKLGANGVLCYWHAIALLKDRAEKFTATYGVSPQLRAGIHCGTVVVGEMGDDKREIAFLGDTVNTTARILEACKKLGKSILVSENVVHLAGESPNFTLEPIGVVELRGKTMEVQLYSLSEFLGHRT